MDYSNPNNVIKRANCRQSFYRSSPNKSEHAECEVYNNIFDKEVQIYEPIEFEVNSNNSATFRCLESKKKGNFRYIVLEKSEREYLPLALSMKAYSVAQTIKITKRLLEALIQVSSFGLNSKNIPYSHNNVNPNNILIAKLPGKED